LFHWRDTAGAVPWLRETLKLARPKVPKSETDKRSWNRLKTKLAGLPLDSTETWHVGVNALAVPGDDQVWALVALSPTREELISVELTQQQPSANEALQWLSGAMLAPDDQDPRRPGRVRVDVQTLAEAWQPRLAEVEIDCGCVESLEDLREYLQLLQHELVHRTDRQSNEPLDDTSLIDLPQTGEVWQIDMRLLAAFIGDRGTPQRPWAILVGDMTNGLVIGQDLVTGEPPKNWMTQVLRSAVSAPAAGPPRRPAEVHVATVKQLAELEGWLKELEIRCMVSESLDFLDSLYTDITQHLAEDSPPGILTVPGVTPELAAGTFAAAADFYRAAPWRLVSADVPIRIESTAFQSGPWFAVVMGQGGMLQGLALYEDLALLRKLLGGRMKDDGLRRKNAGLTMYFGEAFDIPAADLHDLERLGWPIAGPEAYPILLRVNQGMNIRRPLAWELKLLEASLRAVMAFVQHKAEKPISYEIPTSGGPVPLTLSWNQ
jgi:hypothetical protein